MAITYIKNSQPTSVLANNLSLYKAHFYKKSDLSNLQILSSTIYILLHKEKHSKKSKKWTSQVLKRILVDFNRYKIYKIYFKDQNKVIWVKNL